MDRQTVERRREYVQNIRNSFYEENGMQKRETREVDDSAPEMGLAAALKLRIFLSVCIFAAFLGCMYTHTDLCGYSTQTITEMICDNHYYTNLKNYVMSRKLLFSKDFLYNRGYKGWKSLCIE